MYKQLIKPILFSVDPETIHYRIFNILKTVFKLPGAGTAARSLYSSSDARLRRQVFGIDFPNPVGLAAGFDKNAVLFNELSNLGFGFIETGTLTPKPQPGNPRPRLFRLPKDQALINRMGFNNQGVEAAAEQLKKRRPGLVIGGNIGKNKTTPNQEAVNDYLYCFRALYDYVDYFVVNVSSPNTPGLRELQEKEPLSRILRSLTEAGAAIVLNRESDAGPLGSDTKNSSERDTDTPAGSAGAGHGYSGPDSSGPDSSGPAGRAKPILLKIAPDLSTSQLDDIIEIVASTGIDGIIASNTTISREGLETDAETLGGIGAGGLSGRPLASRATEVIRYLVEKSGGAFPVIGVGGIHSPADALEKLEAGASLIQLYTGFIYEGPGLIKRINRAILSRDAAKSQAG